MGPDNGAQLHVVVQPRVRDEFPYVILVGPAGFRVGEVCEPFFLRRHVGEALEFGAGERPFSDRNQLHRLDPSLALV